MNSTAGSHQSIDLPTRPQHIKTLVIHNSSSSTWSHEPSDRQLSVFQTNPETQSILIRIRRTDKLPSNEPSSSCKRGGQRARIIFGTITIGYSLSGRIPYGKQRWPVGCPLSWKLNTTLTRLCCGADFPSYFLMPLSVWSSLSHANPLIDCTQNTGW